MFTLARKIDIHYPTNRWIAIIAILVTGVSYFLTREFSMAWKVGASVFLTWALTREIDPKREYAAFVSAFLALSTLVVDFQVDLMLVFFILLAMRYVNKITGDKSTILDMVTLLGFAGFLSYRGGTSDYLLILLMAIFFTRDTSKDKKKNTIFFIVTTLVTFIQIFNLGGLRLSGNAGADSWIISASVGISLILYFIFVQIDKDKDTRDDNGENLAGKRILAGQLILFVALSFSLIYRKAEIGNLIIYLSSIWGYMIYGTFSMLKNKKIQA